MDVGVKESAQTCRFCLAMICPGHRAVHEFGDSELYEDEGETEYVILDLGSQIEPTLLHGTKSYRLIVRPLSGSFLAVI